MDWLEECHDILNEPWKVSVVCASAEMEMEAGELLENFYPFMVSLDSLKP